MQIRSAELKDISAINAIYNEAVLHSTATFDTKEKSLSAQETWFHEHQGTHPILVAERNEKILGWASLNRWSPKAAYDITAELSVYVKEEYQGQGIGKALIEAIILEGKENKFHSLIARITEGNELSVQLHHRFGFKEMGIMKEAGKKFGKLLDVHFLQLMYN